MAIRVVTIEKRNSKSLLFHESGHQESTGGSPPPLRPPTNISSSSLPTLGGVGRRSSLVFSNKYIHERKSSYMFLVNAIKEPSTCIFCLQRRYPPYSQLYENLGLLKTLMNNGKKYLEIFCWLKCLTQSVWKGSHDEHWVVV